jgi:hypothetical protein
MFFAQSDIKEGAVLQKKRLQKTQTIFTTFDKN